MEKADRKSLLILVDEATHKALGHLAVERGTTKSELVRGFIAAGLAPMAVTMPEILAAPQRLAPPSFVQTPADMADDRFRALYATEDPR